MQGILIRTAITMLGLFLAARIIPGVAIVGTGTFVLAALLLGLVNALVRPVVFLLTLPLTILTLGLFLSQIGMKAGQNAPSGRILCFDKDRVYGYARKSIEVVSLAGEMNRSESSTVTNANTRMIAIAAALLTAFGG